jgi:hypothetical protein
LTQPLADIGLLCCLMFSQCSLVGSGLGFGVRDAPLALECSLRVSVVNREARWFLSQCVCSQGFHIVKEVGFPVDSPLTMCVSITENVEGAHHH